MQNFKTVTQTLLEKTAHFGFCPPKIGVFRGLGGVPKIFSLIGIFIFLWVRSPSKKLKSYHTPLCQFSNGGNKKNNKKTRVEKFTKNSGLWRFRRNRLHSAARTNNYKGALVNCDACYKRVPESQTHVMICAGYEQLRAGKDMGTDGDLVNYFRDVLLLREKRKHGN